MCGREEAADNCWKTKSILFDSRQRMDLSVCGCYLSTNGLCGRRGDNIGVGGDEVLKEEVEVESSRGSRQK